MSCVGGSGILQKRLEKMKPAATKSERHSPRNRQRRIGFQPVYPVSPSNRPPNSVEFSLGKLNAENFDMRVTKRKCVSCIEHGAIGLFESVADRGSSTLELNTAEQA